MSQTKVFLIARMTGIVTELEHLLGLYDIQTQQVESWDQAQSLIAADRPSLIVIDCPGLGVDMLALCQEVRSRYSGLMVLISDGGDEQLHILALSLGADISLSQDSGAPLIAAQIKALVRRFAPSDSEKVLTFGGLTVDAKRRDVFITGQAAQLSTLEFNLFWTLVNNAGCVVSRETIHHELYNSTYNGYDRGVDLSISRIRQKIGDDPNLPRYLKTVRGVGYQFVA